MILSNTLGVFRIALIFLPCLVSAQDSTRLISIPKWRVEFLIRDALLLRSCDSLQNALSASLQASGRVIAHADTLLAAKDRQLTLKGAETQILVARLDNSKEENKALKSEIRKQRALTIAVSVVSVLTIILIL